MKPIERFTDSIESLNGESTLIYQEIANDVAKREGKRIINFGIGQPDVPTFKEIKDAAKEAIDTNFTKYTPSLGIYELRKAVAEYVNQKYGEELTAENVAITPGTKVALYLSLLLYIKPGDEVIIFDPSFYSYSEAVKMLFGRPIFSKLRKDNNFSIDLSEFQSKITPKTKVVILNNPVNPTGTIFSRKEVTDVVKIAKDNNVVVIADEIYDNFIYEGQMSSVLRIPEWKENVIYVNGFSKTFSMTGWRLGYVIAEREVINKVSILATNIYTCATSFVQKAALAAFRTFNEVNEMVNLFRRRRDTMFASLSSVKGIRITKPQATFYMFVDFSEIMNRINVEARELAIKLIREVGVVTIPGSVFPLEQGRGFLRLSFAVDEEDIKEGINRIKEMIEKL
ncbi:aspartate aminotransferase [Sulfolobales archaeon HS-7]|nr:aspartate aminotransferase [Sulfolobales archaeon HS-7]